MTRTCIKCRKEIEIPCNDETFRALVNWRRDARSIQDIAPSLSPDYREMFVSGICPKCWDELFGEEEDE